MRVKRTFDLLLSASVLILLSPLFAIITLAVRYDGGRAFYRGVRVGRYGRHFTMLKFRTMVPNADRIGGTSTADDDPRLTNLGRFLRRLKLDELPQLLNVLSGQMSLVGPRPQVPEDVAKYTDEEMALLDVPPGITDYASIKFANEGEILRGELDPDEAYIRLIRPEKIKLGLEYVQTRSLAVDIKILALTAIAVLSPRIAIRALPTT